MGEYDLERKLIERAESREAMKRTTRSVIKGSAIVGAFIGYCTLAIKFPDAVATISITGFVGVLVVGLIWSTYTGHLKDVQRRD